MIVPEEILIGAPMPADGPPLDLAMVEIGRDAATLPDATDVARVTTGRAVALYVSPVITHPRRNPIYKGMVDPPPAHAAVGHFERSRWTDEAWEQTDAWARATGGQAAVLRTPSSFKATPDNEERLENFVAAAARAGLTLAWEWAPGSWSPSRASAACDTIGLIPVVDPATQADPERELVYFRVGARGDELTDDQIKRVAIAARDRAGWIVLCTADPVIDAARIHDMI